MNIVTNKLKKTTIITIIFSIISLVFLSTIAYSAFSSTMTITGTAHTRVEANVRITDFRLSSTNNATSSYEDFGKRHISTNINLTNSSSSITYYLEITNYGTVDVGILNITGLPSELNYSIKDYNLTDKICDDLGKCNSFITKTYELTLTTTSQYEGNIQMNFDFRTYHKVTYTNIESQDYPTEVIDGGNLKITFKEGLEKVSILSNKEEIQYYEQINNGQIIMVENVSNEIEIKKKKELVAKLISGNLYTIGSEICINNECFYIISNNGLTITMLSKMNITTDDTPIQISSAPTIAFSSTNYWGSVSPESYVYDSNSILYNYIENYKTYLENQGADIKNARLMKTEELEALGCSKLDYSCTKAPSWVYETSFWSGSVYGSSPYIWNVNSDGYFDNTDYGMYTNERRFGIRPVIEMSADEIYVHTAKLVNGDVETVGSEACLGEECFYVISSNHDTVTMFAKYNLYVGGYYNNSTREWTSYGTEATGKQDSTMLGYVSGKSILNGTTAFSTSSISYSGSIVEEYLNSYKNFLLSNSYINNIRLITKSELEELGCSSAAEICGTSSYSFIYSSSYWLEPSSTILYYGGATGFDSTSQYTYNAEYGVRPVIEIPIWMFEDTFGFTINDTAYYAKKGMTWNEWINSQYSPSDWKIYTSDGVYVPSVGYSDIYCSGKKELFSNQIINGEAYTVVNNGD